MDTMESEEASINLRKSNDTLKIVSEHNDDADDLGVDDSSKNSCRRKHTSDVWNHFKRVKIENIQSVTIARTISKLHQAMELHI